MAARIKKEKVKKELKSPSVKEEEDDCEDEQHDDEESKPVNKKQRRSSSKAAAKVTTPSVRPSAVPGKSRYVQKFKAGVTDTITFQSKMTANGCAWLSNFAPHLTPGAKRAAIAQWGHLGYTGHEGGFVAPIPTVAQLQDAKFSCNAPVAGARHPDSGVLLIKLKKWSSNEAHYQFCVWLILDPEFATQVLLPLDDALEIKKACGKAAYAKWLKSVDRVTSLVEGKKQYEIVTAKTDTPFKLKVMKAGLVAKFTQSAELKRCLLATGDAKLMEKGNTGGSLWVANGGNKLGILLEEVRSELDKGLIRLAPLDRPPARTPLQGATSSSSTSRGGASSAGGGTGGTATLTLSEMLVKIEKGVKLELEYREDKYERLLIRKVDDIDDRDYGEYRSDGKVLTAEQIRALQVPVPICTCKPTCSTDVDRAVSLANERLAVKYGIHTYSSNVDCYNYEYPYLQKDIDNPDYRFEDYWIQPVRNLKRKADTATCYTDTTVAKCDNGSEWVPPPDVCGDAPIFAAFRGSGVVAAGARGIKAKGSWQL